MKKIQKLILLISFFILASAKLYAQVYKSMIQGRNFVQKTLREDRGILIASKTSINPEKGIGSRVYNLTDLEFTDKRLTIPGDNNYWWIPFEEGQEPINLRPYSNWCYECKEFGGCYSPIACAWQNVGNNCQQCLCGNGSSGKCYDQRCECNSARKIVREGIIVMATRVVFK